jgi:O-acetylhomoserine (thiol)-lyase
MGADIVVYSTTKVITGNASALGGCAVFRAISEGEDKLKTSKYAFLQKFIEKAGAMALIVNAKKRALRDFGMSANAHASYQTMLGLETLPLRYRRITQSIELIAKELNAAGIVVNHPSLQKHPHHHLYTSDFKDGTGTLFTIDMGTKEKAYSFLNKTQLATITANIGDSRTLALHMASTIYSDFDTKTREFLGITDGLIRVSVGLENPQDIINDFLNAAR